MTNFHSIPTKKIEQYSFMENYSLDELSEISGNNCRIQIKVSRKWKELHPTNNQVLGLNFIFVDRYVSLLHLFQNLHISHIYRTVSKYLHFYIKKQHNRSHCWVESMNMKMFEDVLYEGNMYEIQQFEVEEYSGSNRCFETEHHLILSNYSIVTKLDDTYITIPHNVFVFANLRNIHQLGQQNAALIGKNNY